MKTTLTKPLFLSEVVNTDMHPYLVSQDNFSNIFGSLFKLILLPVLAKFVLVNRQLVFTDGILIVILVFIML